MRCDGLKGFSIQGKGAGYIIGRSGRIPRIAETRAENRYISIGIEHRHSSSSISSTASGHIANRRRQEKFCRFASR